MHNKIDCRGNIMSTKNLIRLVLIGATATGKGTLSALIMEAFDNFMHISPGNILRLHVKLQTDLGCQVKDYLDKGVLVPDKLIVDSIFRELEKAKKNNWLLDGFPRTLDQVCLLHDIKNSGNEKKISKNQLNGVFNLIVPDDVIIKRVSNRWIHLPSGRVYNKGFREPRVLWKDDVSGEDLVQRADDAPEVVAERLRIHRQQTEPIISFYRDYGIDVLDLQSEHMDKIWKVVHTFISKKLQF